MKKILSIIVLLASLILLVGCSNKVPVSNDEFHFYETITESTKGVVALTNDSDTEKRLVSGIIFKKVTNGLMDIYYVLTSRSLVASTENIEVYLTVSNKLPGKLHDFEHKDLAIVTFESGSSIEFNEFKELDEAFNLVAREVFSIGTQVYLSYFNMPTEPSRVNKDQDDLIIHASNINQGMLGSPLFLKSNGTLVGINIFYNTYMNDRPVSRINHALHINHIIELLKGV